MLTMLETRGKIHFTEVGVYPACRSRAEVLGFHHRADGKLTVPVAWRNRLCAKCMESLGLSADHA